MGFASTAIATLSLCLLGTSLSADTYQRQPFDVLHYWFRLTLADHTNQIEGQAGIEAVVLKDGVVDLSLDLIEAGDAGGMSVSEARLGNQPLTYSHGDGKLVLHFPSPSRAGERHRITIRYSGVPATGLRIGPNLHGDRTFFGLNWPNLARHWLPMIDHPYDKATSEFMITAPASYRVIANGKLLEERDLGDGRRLTHWKQSVAIPSWLNMIGVAQFSTRYAGEVKGIPVQTWVFPQDYDKAGAVFDERNRKALEFFIERIGPYPYEKLAHIQSPGLSGAAENASAIVYDDRAVSARRIRYMPVEHEIAHQWFGDSVTQSDWDDVWLSEGFATYFALLATEHYAGRDAFMSNLAASRKFVLEIELKEPGLRVAHNNLADMTKVLDGIVYQKGAWTLHMLRSRIGTDKFWSGIREYYRRYRDSNANTDDFRKVMEESAGEDLRWFFDQWLHRTGSPVINGGWRYDSQAKSIEIDLSQTQANEPYRLNLHVAVWTEGDSAPTPHAFEMRERRQSFQLSTTKPAIRVELDPENATLMSARFTKQ